MSRTRGPSPSGEGPRFVSPVGRRAGWLCYVVLTIGVSAAVYLPVLTSIKRKLFATSDDSSLFIWWIAHTGSVVAGWFGAGDAAGADTGLLYTTWMNYPAGVGGAWNTSIVGLALPMLPVTWLAGPVAAYNVLVVACPVASALAGSLALRRFMSLPGAWFAGLLYGLSTYVVAQSGGHINLAFAILPPIVVGGLYDAFYTAKRRRWIGARVGAAVAFQLYVSTELLAATAIFTVIVLIVLLIADRRIRAGFVRRLVPVAGIAAVIGAAIGAPLLLALASAQAPHGQLRPSGVWDTDVLAAIRPAAATWLQLPGPSYPVSEYIDIAERGAYLGVPLLVIAAAVVVFGWRMHSRRVIVRTAAVMAVVSWLLSLGSVLYLAGDAVERVPLPWRLFDLIPGVVNILPMRLAVFTTLAVAVLAGIGFDTAIGASRAVRVRRAGAVRVVTIAVAAGTVLTILPGPVDARGIDVPQFFASGAPTIPTGAVVKTVPRAQAIASPHADEAMAWQAIAGMRYRSTGGYFIGSSTDRPVIYQAPADGYDRALDRAKESGKLPDAASRAARAAGRAIVDGPAQYVVIAPNPWLALPPKTVARWTGAITHSPVRHRGGVWVVAVGK